jgi:hypothetical protein
MVYLQPSKLPEFKPQYHEEEKKRQKIANNLNERLKHEIA